MDWLFQKNKIETTAEMPQTRKNDWRKANVVFCTIFFIIGLAGWMLPLSSCESSGPSHVSELDPVKLDPAIKNVDDASKKTGEVSKSVGESASKIDQHTDSIRQKTETTPVFPAIEPDIKGIKTETDSLRQDQVELIALQKQLESTVLDLEVQKQRYEAVTKNADELRGRIAQLEKGKQKLLDENGRLFKKLLAWMGVICVGGIGLSAVLGFFTRSSLAIFLGLGFLVTLGVSIVVTLYMTWIAYITIAAAAIMGTIAVIYVLKHQHTEKKALEEVVHTSEITKQYLDPKARLHIFGHGPEGGVADRVQSKSTKRVVAHIRDMASKPKVKKFDLAKSIAPLPPEPQMHSMEAASAVFARSR